MLLNYRSPLLISGTCYTWKSYNNVEMREYFSFIPSRHSNGPYINYVSSSVYYCGITACY
jgi:hypothetical protein